ncbi:MAG TPA: 4-hydroxythreonine-4-phosphate dehydrogenase, partial [Burkholderiaceae bacterium]
MTTSNEVKRPSLRRPRLAITTGEPAGIGPEISIRAAWQLRDEADCILIGDAAFLSLTANTIDPAIKLVATTLAAIRNGGLPDFGRERIAVIDCPLNEVVVPG